MAFQPPFTLPQVPPLAQNNSRRNTLPLTPADVISPIPGIESFDDDPDKISNLSLQQLELFCVKCNEVLTNDLNQAIECGEWAAQRAFLLGRALISVKKLAGHGNWKKWVESHLPSTSIETARRYMRLAKGTKDSVLQGKGLCSAYRASGILPATQSAKPAQPSPLPAKILDKKYDQCPLESLIDKLIQELGILRKDEKAIPQHLVNKCHHLDASLRAAIQGPKVVKTRRSHLKTVNADRFAMEFRSSWLTENIR